MTNRAWPTTSNVRSITLSASPLWGAIRPVTARSCFAAAVGWYAWNGSVEALCTAPLLVLLWRWSPSRIHAFAAVFAYYLAAARGLFHGAGVFFGEAGPLPDWVVGALIWLIPNAILAATWALLWGARTRPVRLLLILIVVSLPPVGVFGWANPLTAAGALFPSWGWAGIALTICLLCAMATFRRRTLPYLGALLSLSVLANIGFHQPVADDWIPLNTHLGAAKNSEAEYERLQTLLNMVGSASAAHPHAKVFVLPELVGGDWSMNSIWWDDIGAVLKDRGQTVLVGALLPYDRNRRYVNALFSIGDDDSWALVDRVPVPISMWRPWSATGATAFWWDSGVVTIGSRRAASLICYEQLLVWPVLVSLAHRPDIIVGAANDWWARGTSIPRIQRQVTNAWGRLFAIPAVWATNQ
ncbi:hypothetical protein FX016_23015 [Cupriavidus gilardii]|nr:hypothetical protein FX016_23015 [Cupriavidus gilardii]